MRKRERKTVIISVRCTPSDRRKMEKAMRAFNCWLAPQYPRVTLSSWMLGIALGETKR